MRQRKQIPDAFLLVVATLVVVGCSGRTTRTPVVVAPRSEEAAAPENRSALSLPLVMPVTRWRVRMESILDQVQDSRPPDRLAVQGLVQWELSRDPVGALRGRGVVDSFTVRSSLDSTARASVAPALLMDVVLDSTTVRVMPRPVLTNSCDRPETVAASLAREVLIRIPNGMTVGATWRDSSVTFLCRDGVPLTVTTMTRTRLVELSSRRGVIERVGVMRVSGSGGPVYRAMTVQGEGDTRDRVELDLTRGTVDRLRGERTLTLRIMPRPVTTRPRPVIATAPTQTVVVTQRVTTTVDRLPN